MRSFRPLLALLVVLGGLLAYLYFVDAKRPLATEAENTKAKVFTVESDKIEEIHVTTAGGDKTHLKKVQAGWETVAPEAGKADESEASSVASALASLEQQRVVDENASDLAQYGLATPRVDVAFKASGSADFKHLLVGDKTPTGGDLYARLPENNKVFLISGYLDTTFNKKPFDFRDKTILKFERDAVDTVEIVSASGPIQIAKSGPTWNLTKPLAAGGEYAAVEGLIGRLQSGQMKSIAAKDASDLKPYGLDKPEATVTLAAGSARATLLVGKAAPEAGTVYAKDASRPEIFTVEGALADELKKGVAEYRRKDAFEFRPYTANRVDVTRGSETIAFEKVKGQGENAQDKWRQVLPAVKDDVDQPMVENLITKLTNMRALSFADASTKTGLDAPVLTVVAKFDEGKKQERVTFGKVGSDVYAARQNEPGAAKLDSNEFDDAIKALDAVKAPPQKPDAQKPEAGK